MCDKVVSKELFMLKYCLDRHKTQEMCDKAVGACLPALRLVPDWFIRNKMLEKHDNVAFTNDDIDFDDIVIVNGIGLVILMMIILMKMILLIFFLLDLLLGDNRKNMKC